MGKIFYQQPISRVKSQIKLPLTTSYCLFTGPSQTYDSARVARKRGTETCSG